MQKLWKVVFAAFLRQFYGRPGNAELLREGLVITKLFKKDHAGMQSEVLYEIEKKILQRLENRKPACGRKRRHFPKLHATHDGHRSMKMTYMGSTLKTDEKQFHDHPPICIKQDFSFQGFQKQVDCILETLSVAHVRHLDLQCGPAGHRDSLKHFNVAYDERGTISLIDFELSTVDEHPAKWYEFRNLTSNIFLFRTKHFLDEFVFTIHRL